MASHISGYSPFRPIGYRSLQEENNKEHRSWSRFKTEQKKMDTPILKQTWKSTTEKTQTVEPITQKHDLFKGVKKWLREIKKQKRVNRVHTHLTVIRWSKRHRRLD